jgi:hypothetical protein
MRAFILILLISTITGAYALGRWQRPDPGEGSELGTLESFRSAFDRANSLERSYRFHGFLQTMGPTTVDEAAETIETFGPWLVSDELSNFMIVWASFDPRAALDWALTRSGPFRAQAAAAAIVGWAFHDPAGAQHTLEELDPRSTPSGLEEHLIAGWLAGGQHDGVAEYIAAQPAGMERQRYTNLLMIEIMRDGPDAVIRWAESVAEDQAGSYKRTAFQKAANIVAAVDPVLASRWVESHLDHEYADRLPLVVARRWMDADPSAALDWLASLPAGDHDKALKTALLSWLNQSPESAETWLAEATPAPSLDLAIELMLSRSGDDAQASMEWALRFDDPVARHRSVIRFGRTWLRRDPEAANAWLAESTLSPQIKKAILKPKTSAPGEPRSPEVRARPGAGAPEPGSPG